MRTLVIHPEDRSTEFLKRIYEPIPEATLFTGGVTRDALRRLVDSHDRILMLGHGSFFGLGSVGRFPESGEFVVDHRFSDLLRQKTECVYIWCYAWKFVKANKLAGFTSDMFVSQADEAEEMGISATSVEIEESNEAFGRIVGRHIRKESLPLFESVCAEYGRLARRNPVAAFNLERLFIRTGEEAYIRA
jgi:hypothetical protein